jgi:hypothetical protein
MPKTGVERSMAPVMSFAPGGGLDGDRQEIRPEMELVTMPQQPRPATAVPYA